MIISGFPGIGKTTLAKKYKNVIDFDAMTYKFDLTEEQKKKSYEEIKGLPNRVENKNWPNNYIEEIIRKNEEYDIVLISQHTELLEELENRKIDYIAVFPKDDLIEEYTERYIKRENPKEYIDRRREIFYSQIKYLKQSTKRNWILESEEYLEDRLIKEKVYLEKKEK